jgi:MoaA/NifB/PqqE/SkfB family radical SAM enzyme
MWNYDKLSAVHLELSSICNASCPGCPRYLRNSTNVDTTLVQRSISFNDFSSWFKPVDLVKIKGWIICGTHGDPLACKDFLEIVEYICEHSPGKIQINTNGGLRTPKYFRELGEIFVKAKGRDDFNRLPHIHREVVFSIDGLEDTNHRYRRNVMWNKVMENLTAYVKTGAFAAWDYLQFAHNAHQINDAKKLAENLHMDFRLKNPFGVEGSGMPVLDDRYNLVDVLNSIHTPDLPPYTPPELDYIPTIPSPVTRSGCIDCNAFRDKGCEIYIDHQGKIQPCCFVGNKMYGFAVSPDSVEVRQIQNSLGNKNSLYHHSLKEILNSNVLDKYSDTWKDKTLNQCWNVCGKNDIKNRDIDILFVKF